MNYADCSLESNYFVKMKDCAYTREQMARIINGIDFSKEVNSTAGFRSLTKDELITKINLALGQGVDESDTGDQAPLIDLEGADEMGQRGLTYGQIRKTIERIEAAKDSFQAIPPNYVERLNAAIELLRAIECTSAPNWDEVSLDDPEELEKAEQAVAERKELIVQIRQYFADCSMLVNSYSSRDGERERPPRRSKEEVAQEKFRKDLDKSIRRDFGFQLRG